MRVSLFSWFPLFPLWFSTSGILPQFCTVYSLFTSFPLPPWQDVFCTPASVLPYTSWLTSPSPSITTNHVKAISLISSDPHLPHFTTTTLVGKSLSDKNSVSPLCTVHNNVVITLPDSSWFSPNILSYSHTRVHLLKKFNSQDFLSGWLIPHPKFVSALVAVVIYYTLFI